MQYGRINQEMQLSSLASYFSGSEKHDAQPLRCLHCANSGKHLLISKVSEKKNPQIPSKIINYVFIS